MKIVIRDQHQLLSPEAIERTKTKVTAAFSKFGLRISRVEISVEDVNGPRGGVDQQCRVVAKLKKMGDVMATVTDASLAKSIRSAISRAERGVSRRIRKHSVGDNDRSSNFGFAFYD